MAIKIFSIIVLIWLAIIDLFLASGLMSLNRRNRLSLEDLRIRRIIIAASIILGILTVVDVFFIFW